MESYRSGFKDFRGFRVFQELGFLKIRVYIGVKNDLSLDFQS